MVEWNPMLGLRPAPGQTGILRDLENAYLEDLSDGSFIHLLMAYNNTSEPVLVPNPTNCGDMNIGRCSTSTDTSKIDGHLDGIERQRMMPLLILTHEMRREIMGEEPRTSAQMTASYPINPFWNWGALAETSEKACDAVRASLPKWMNNDDVKRECGSVPQARNGEYKDCVNGGRCIVPRDLPAMGLPLRWLGFMVQPALTANQADNKDPEPSSLVKVGILGAHLEEAGLSTHHALMFVSQQMHKFFGPDQSWTMGNPFVSQGGWVQEFQAMGNIGVPQRSTQEHMTAHAARVQSIQKMLSLLTPEVTLYTLTGTQF